MATLPKCSQCGLHFKDETTLQSHDKSFHASKTCEKCGKEVLEANFKKHMAAHRIETGYSTVVSQGRIKAVRTKDKADKPDKPSGYKLFMKTMRPKIRNQNPDISPQEMVRKLNLAWNNEKDHGRKKYWDEKAKEAAADIIEDVQESDAAVPGPGPLAVIEPNVEVVPPLTETEHNVVEPAPTVTVPEVPTVAVPEVPTVVPEVPTVALPEVPDVAEVPEEHRVVWLIIQI